MTTQGSISDPRAGTRITRSFVGLIWFASLVMTLVVGGASLYSAYAPLRQRTEEIFSVVLGQSSDQVRALLETAQADLISITHAPRFGDATLAAIAQVAQGEAPDSDLHNYLAASLSQTPKFEGLLVLGPGGSILANVGSGAALEGLLDALTISDAMGGDELLEIMKTRQLQGELGGVSAPSIRTLDVGAATPAVIVASPVLGEDGVSVASVLGLVRQQEIVSRLRGDLLGGSGDILLVDDLGQLVSARRDSGVASIATLAERTPGETDTCRLRIDWSAAWDGAATCTLSLSSLGWVLAASQPVHSVFRPLVIMVPIVLVCALIAALGLSLLAFRAAATIVDPLGVLHRGIVAVSKGDFSTDVSEGSARGEVKLVIRAFNRLVSHLRDKDHDSESSRLALKVQNKSFQQKFAAASELSVTDPLTQLNNRRYFEENLEREINRLGPNGEGLFLLVIDIDDFKAINDNFGHTAGDEILKQIARTMKETVRESDLLARFGGEEFVVVLKGTDIRGATILAEKLRTNIAEASFIIDDSMRPRRATVSIGLARYQGSQTDLFNAADAALYRAKDAGKNCVILSGE